MVSGLDFLENDIMYRFNLNTFTSEINPLGKSNEVTLAEAISRYFDFSEDTIHNKSCFFSKKFEAYILPLENQMGEKNFVIVKNGQVFNPNEFTGFSVGNDLRQNPHFISDLNYGNERGNWIYFSMLDKELVDFVIEKYNLSPQFEDSFNGKILHLLSCIPVSWHYTSQNTLKISEPSIEDRTILINLLPDNDFIEFENDIIIILNNQNVDLLSKHCLTLYSTL